MFTFNKEQMKQLFEDLIFNVADTNIAVAKDSPDSDDAVVLLLSNAWLVYPYPFALYYEDLRMGSPERELELLYKVSGWLLGHYFLKSPSFDDYTRFTDTEAPMHLFINDKVVTYPYLSQNAFEKLKNKQITMHDALELYINAIDYFRNNPHDFKFTQNDVIYLTPKHSFICDTFNVYNIKSLKDYDKVEIDIYNSLNHSEDIEEIYFEEIYPEIEETIKGFQKA